MLILFRQSLIYDKFSHLPVALSRVLPSIELEQPPELRALYQYCLMQIVILTSDGFDLYFPKYPSE